MTRPAFWLTVGGMVAIVIAIWVNADHKGQPSPIATEIVHPASSPRPKLALLTSLPILFGDRFGLDIDGSPVIDRLGEHYEVQAIGVADSQSLQPFTVLLMAHPRAQPASVLVELDGWVRQGGCVMLLADPRLDWPSDRPLGDKLRPPPDFADTGLLDHWGLALSGPTVDGAAVLHIDGMEVIVASPGALSARGKNCSLFASGFGARCSVGRGKVVVLADADLLNVTDGDSAGGTMAGNLALVERELARLAH